MCVYIYRFLKGNLKVNCLQNQSNKIKISKTNKNCTYKM